MQFSPKSKNQPEAPSDYIKDIMPESVKAFELWKFFAYSQLLTSELFGYFFKNPQKFTLRTPPLLPFVLNTIHFWCLRHPGCFATSFPDREAHQ